MATARTPANMPGLFTPRRSRVTAGTQSNMFEPTARFTFGSETSRRQVTDGDHETRRRNTTLTSPPSAEYAFGSSSWVAATPDYSRSSAARSPPPLANDRYELAGGMEASAGSSSQHHSDYDDYFNLEQQRGMWSSPTSPNNGAQQQGDRAHATHNSTKPWVLNQIMSVVGGVAGKLVRFCAVPFRGFQAGGGQAYTFGENGKVAAKLFNDEAPGPVQQPPAPGHFPEEDCGVRSIHSIDSEEGPRMAKRLRTGDSWVVVDKDLSVSSRPLTPRLTERRVPAHISPSQIPRPVSRASLSTPSQKRPSLIPVSRRSTYDKRSRLGAADPATPAYGHARTYSRENYTSPVMFENTKSKSTSPLPPESQRLINKVRRENFEDDARMRRMSMQMDAMMREAREALGSTFEMNMDTDDGRFT